MASSTEIANMALAHLGTGKKVADLELEESTEARALRVFFDTARKACFEDFDFPFARKMAQLNLVENNPNDRWGYSYRYPSDCLKARKIFSGLRVDNRQSRVEYEIGSDNIGKLIYTDEFQAQLIYTKNIEDLDLYPSAFIIGFSYRLAYYIAPQLTGGDPFKLQDKMLQLYEFEMSKATANDANEEQPRQDPDSEFTRSREDNFWER